MPTIGIDLGTTNSCLAFAADGGSIDLLEVPQLVRAAEVEARPLLPSFLYLPADAERVPGAHALPWSADGAPWALGVHGRERGTEVPTRLVSSSKSWLCHDGVDRSAPILPWEAPEGVDRLSPVEAAAATLGHLRDAWNHRAGGDADGGTPLERLSVVLTVPASFDAVARDLTVRAAESVGLGELTLLEEPQAALYAWIAARGEAWRDELAVGDRILVVDVGGGTTDLSLIDVAQEDGELVLERVAVGDHILLGGDNMDLTLAHTAAARLGGRLDRWQMVQLTHAARRAKEVLLEDPEAGPQPVTVVGRGSGLVGGTLHTELTPEEVERVLVDGFFPVCGLGEQPAQAFAPLREVGLPYAHDPAISRHLAAFLTRAGGPLPTRVLFNGGVLQATRLRRRVEELLAAWAAEGDAGAPPRTLESAGLDTAVAQGAAYYGLARAGKGVRIRGGTARSYYVGIETARPAVPGIPPPVRALCVAPSGMEEGTDTRVSGQEFVLSVGQTVRFRFFSSAARPDDGPGAWVDEWDLPGLHELSPVEASLGEGESGPQVPVRLHSRVTELGTLELYLQGREEGERWRLGFDVRERAGAPG